MKRLDSKLSKGSKPIFTIEYLCNAELTEQDLNDVFSTFTLSIIVGMHRHIGDSRTTKQIIDSCKKDINWFNNKVWSLKSYELFKTQLVQIYKNVWVYGPEKSLALAEMWLNNYGFRIDKNMK